MKVCRNGHAYIAVGSNKRGCLECEKASKQKRAQRIRSEPELLERERARGREWARRKYHANPEVKKQRKREWYARNKAKVLAAMKQQYAADPDTHRERARARRAADPARARDTLRAWRARDPEGNARSHRKHAQKRNAASREWKKAHKDKLTEYDHRRRARRKGVNAPGVTGREWATICARFTNGQGGTLCVYCAKTCKPTRDHVVPLSRGGADAAANVVPACLACNLAKSTRLVTEWPAARRLPPELFEELAAHTRRHTAGAS